MKIGINNSLCSGCRVCQLICALTCEKVNNPKKGRLEIVGHFPVPGGYEIKMTDECNQCGQCVKFCPMGALYREDEE